MTAQQTMAAGQQDLQHKQVAAVQDVVNKDAQHKQKLVQQRETLKAKPKTAPKK